MKAILISLMIIAVVGGMVGSGLFAYFSDTETSEDNVFQAGTIDVMMDGAGFVEEPDAADIATVVPQDDPGTFFAFTSLDLGDVKPCMTRWIVIKIENAGANDGTLTVTFVAVDGVLTGQDMSNYLYIDSATVDGSDILGDLVTAYDTDADGKVTVAELVAGLPFTYGTLASGSTIVIVLGVHFDTTVLEPEGETGADEYLMGATTTIDITAALNQLQ